MCVRFSSRAEADLHEIRSYLAQRSPQGLDRILSAIRTTAGQLETFPLLGHEGRVAGTFEIIVPRTPSFLVYTIPDEIFVDIEGVIHMSRNYPFEV